MTKDRQESDVLLGEKEIKTEKKMYYVFPIVRTVDFKVSYTCMHI